MTLKINDLRELFENLNMYRVFCSGRLVNKQFG